MNFDLAWLPRHKEVMVDFFNYLNRFTDQFVLKGIDQVEYLTNTQTDPLINNEQHQYDFLEVYEKL